MKSRAAVALGPGKPLVIETVDLEGPRQARCSSRSRRPASATPTRTRSRARIPRGSSRRSSATRARASSSTSGPGVTSVAEGRPRHPALHARVPRVLVLHERQDEPLPGHPRDAGQGPDARRHEPLLARRRGRSSTTWGRRRSRTTRCCPRSRSRRSARTRRSTRSATSAAASRPASAPSSTRRRSRPGDNVVVFGLGGIGLNVVQGARLAGADMIVGVDLNPRRRALAETLRHDALREPEGGRGRSRRAPRRAHKGGADYSFECIGNVQRHAPGARVLPQGLGHERHHRRRRRRRGDRDAPVPARHGPRLEGDGLRRRARPHRRARRSSTGTWRARSTSTSSSRTRCRSTGSTRRST